jgi:FAD/FMN-containing dehydrogenase
LIADAECGFTQETLHALQACISEVSEWSLMSGTQSLAGIGHSLKGSEVDVAERALAGRQAMTAATSEDYLSWGRVHRFRHYTVTATDRAILPSVLQANRDRPVLGYGLGRSYGDSCLNEDGILIRMSHLNRVLAFDDETGDLTCESGITLADILAQFTQPRPDGSAWFLPVSPGTRFVTLGGVIANDVHGKNHHFFGTMGRHVRSLELMRSDGTVHCCSPERNATLFNSTIGGLGLTGLILSATVRLRRVPSLWLDVERIRFEGIKEFHALAQESQSDWEYTVAWVDCVTAHARWPRGIFTRANHATTSMAAPPVPRTKPRFAVPITPPFPLFNRATTRVVNMLYGRDLRDRHAVRQTAPYEKVFYPLDAIGEWNRLFGRRGFFQYQCVIPVAAAETAVAELLNCVAMAGEYPVLAVLKTFGNVPSPGVLSFPCEGTTIALDLPNHGPETFALLERLDSITAAAGGRVYPAKDGRMSAERFRRYYPRWTEFASSIDPGFSSSFHRRVAMEGRWPAERAFRKAKSDMKTRSNLADTDREKGHP